MATKKQNRRPVKKRVRRSLNKSPEFFRGISGRKLHSVGYGCGVDRSNIISKENEE